MISKILSKRSPQNMFSTVCNEYCMFHFMMLRGEVNMQLFKVTVSLFCRDVGILDDYFYFGFLSQLVNCMNKSLILKRCLELTEARPHASWYINTNHGTWQAWPVPAPHTRLAITTSDILIFSHGPRPFSPYWPLDWFRGSGVLVILSDLISGIY